MRFKVIFIISGLILIIKSKLDLLLFYFNFFVFLLCKKGILCVKNTNDPHKKFSKKNYY